MFHSDKRLVGFSWVLDVIMSDWEGRMKDKNVSDKINKRSLQRFKWTASFFFFLLQVIQMILFRKNFHLQRIFSSIIHFIIIPCKMISWSRWIFLDNLYWYYFERSRGNGRKGKGEQKRFCSKYKNWHVEVKKKEGGKVTAYSYWILQCHSKTVFVIRSFKHISILIFYHQWLT